MRANSRAHDQDDPDVPHNGGLHFSTTKPSKTYRSPESRTGNTCLYVQVSLLNRLGSAIPARERVVVCEEVFELALRLPDVVAMQTRQPSLEGTGEVRLRRLVKEARRMRPDRIVGHR